MLGLFTVLALSTASHAQRAIQYGRAYVPNNVPIQKLVSGSGDLAGITDLGRVQFFGWNNTNTARSYAQGLSTATDLATGGGGGVIVTSDGRLEGFITEDPPAPPDPDPNYEYGWMQWEWYMYQLADYYRKTDWLRTVPSGSDYAKVAMSHLSGLALRTNGELAAWGHEYSDLQTKYPSGTFRSIAMDDSCGYAVRTNGALATWGYVPFGDTAPADNNYVSVHASNEGPQVVAIRADGSVLHLSSAYNALANVPAIISDSTSPGFVRVKDVAVSWNTGIALLENGKVVAWGTANPIPSDDQVLPLLDVKGVAAAYDSLAVVVTDAPSLSVDLSKSTVEQGQNLTATLNFSISRTRDQVFTVTAGQGVSSAGTVTIPAGSTSAPLLLSVNPYAPAGTKTVRLTSPGYNKTITFEVVNSEVRIASVDTIGTSFGGNEYEARVTLQLPSADSRVIQLSSNNPNLEVPASVTVGARQRTATFKYRVKDIAADASATITASAGNSSASKTTSLRVNKLASFAVSATSARFNQTVTGTVTLTNEVSEDVVVALAASRPGVVPATVRIPAGSRSASFSIMLNATIANKGVKVTATRHGLSRSQRINVLP